MTKEEVFEGLKEIFATIKPKLDLDKVTMDSKLVMDLGVDSLSMLLLSLAAEQKFGMQFQPTAKPFETVGEVCDYILSAVA
jgi:acyl carrier protein